MRGLLSIEASWPANHRTAVTPRSTHRSTQPFTPFGAVWRFSVALWRRLGAPLGLPSSAGCAVWHDHCCPVALPLSSCQLKLNWSGSFVVPVGSAWTGIGAVYGVTRYLPYHGAQQPPALQSPSAASPSLLLATSGAALTSSSAPVAPPVFVPHPQHAAIALHRQ